MNIQLLNGDCLDKLKELEPNSIDSIVTDPPYGLSFMGKKWDYDVPSQQIWEECMRVLKPGGHLLSFAGSRTYHRMAVRIEDAGFDIRDQIMWIYGSGFPKSHNIGKALDKNNGNNNLVSEVADKLKEARESRGISKTEADKLFCDGTTNYSWLEGRKGGVRLPEDDLFQKIVDEWPELKPYQQKVKSANREVIGQYEGDAGGLGGERLGSKGGDITIPSTDVAKQWEGWGTALKPSHEPIVLARKPLVGTVANNVLEYGVGGLNIDGCRVEYQSEEDEKSSIPGSLNSNQKNSLFGMGEGHKHNTTGRFPANIILDEEAGKILDEQSGTVGNGWKKNYGAEDYNGKQYDSSTNQCKHGGGYNGKNTYVDTGGASRFFYCPKANKKDRNEGCDGLEDKGYNINQAHNSKTLEERYALTSKNNHPTVKPTELMKYLIRLVTPKGGVVLDPFMGSGSTGKAAVLEGMNFIGIEREKEYFKIAQTRIEHINKPKTYEKFFE